MNFTKRIMSMLLALMIMLSVCSSGFAAEVTALSPGLKEIVLEPAPGPEAEFYCTEITRVAKAVGSLEPGNTIVKATPSGVPELAGSYVSQAYAGETPVQTTVTFYSPKAGIQVNGISCNNETVVLSGVSYTNGSYTVKVESGTCEKDENGRYEPLIFTIEYTWTDGNQYQGKCVSFVEDIVTGGSYVEAQSEIQALSGTGDTFRLWASASTRLLGKGVYYEMPENVETSEESPYKAYGIYNVATGNPVENVSPYTTLLYADFKTESPAGKHDQTNEIFASDTPVAQIYVDLSAVTTLADMNIRLDSNVGFLSTKNNSNPYTAIADEWAYEGLVTEKPKEDYSNNTDVQNIIGLVIPEKKNYGVTQYSQNEAMATITAGVGQYGNLRTQAFRGIVSGIADGSSYTILTRYYSYMWVKEGLLQHYNMTASATVPTPMTFHVVDKGPLREAMDYVMNTNPELPTVGMNVQGKGVNPQSWYYQSSFDPFKEVYEDALVVLADPKATQADIDATASSLKEKYSKMYLRSADYTEVNELTKIADNIIKNKEHYPESAIEVIMEAKSMVKKNYNIFYQSAVDTMAYNLSVAIDKAKPYAANYSEIENLEKSFNEINHIDYTPESIQSVKDAFAGVDYTLSALEQAQVDLWADEIETKIEELVPAFADFTQLSETLAEAKAVDRKYYRNADILDKPVADAEEAIAADQINPWYYSKQGQVDALTSELRNAIDSLALKDIDKLALKAAIDTEIPGEPEYYDQEILEEYLILVEYGTEVYNNSELTVYEQGIVDAATNAIVSKYQKLILTYNPPRVELLELNEAITSAEELDRSLYCDDDAIKKLDYVVEAGIAIREENLVQNEENMLRVAEATERIRNAIDELNLHKGKVWIENNVEAGCTEAGSYDEVVYCGLCGKELSRNTVIVDALGHVPADEVTEKDIPATTDEDGSYELAVYCSSCGEELSREFIVVPALGHISAEPVKENVTEATCTEDGSYELVVYCTCCENRRELSREFVEVPATGHKSSETKEENRVETTCTDNGYYDAVIYCTVCDEELMRETITVPTMGHRKGAAEEENRIEATCTEAGSYDSVIYCRLCRTKLESETFVIPVTGHTYKPEVTPPTCTENGYTVYTCVCSDTYTSDYTDATGHSYGDWEIVAATCTEDGLKTKTCICGDFITEVISAKGHTEGEWKVTKDADIGVKGEESLFCADCDTVLDTKEIPAISAYFREAEDSETVIKDGFIYGLEEGITNLDGFVEYAGGTVEYIQTEEGFGTGTVVNFIVDGKVFSSYTVVIFGDITGDGVIDTYDATKLAEIVNGDINLDENSAEAFAADIENGDMVADTYDLTTIYAVVNGDITLSQKK